MLPKKNCLKKKSDFDRIFKKGLKFKEDFLSLRMIRNNFGNNIRLGFIVSLKVSKRANIRNKIKRRLRALTATKLSKTKKGFDIVLTANPGLEKKDFWELEEILNTIFKKANLFLK